MKRNIPTYLILVLLYFSCIACLMIFISPFVIDPNGHAFAIGGDPYVIYYDMFYHISYGHGLILEAMNYPWHELIFLTDMQGALSALLSWINGNLMPVDIYSVGITHAMVIFLWPLTGIFIYLILRFYKLPVWLSFTSALLICFLSPQLPRLSGHFGLAYGFIIPACLYWYIVWKEKSPWWLTGILFITLCFFCFNNPYIGFASCILLSLAGFIELIYTKESRRISSNWMPVLLGLIPLLLFFATTKSLDTVSDRVAIQWGFFAYPMKIGGLICPSDSLLNTLLPSFYKGAALPIESQCNLGLVPILLLLIFWIKIIVTRKIRDFQWSVEGMPALALAAFLLLLFSMNFPFYGFLEDWAESNLGPLLMFKASGRFAWPFFYVIELAIIITFYKQFLSKSKYKGIVITLTVIFIGIWGWEDYRYMDYHLSNKIFDNPFHEEKMSEVRELLEANEIQPEEYQAIYVVPIMQAWTDKMLSNLNWNSHFYGLRISAATELPLINAMLSRMSISQTLMSIQFSSHPIIKKELLEYLDPNKPILLLKGGKETPLTIGEQALIAKAKIIYTSDEFSLYRLNPKDLFPSVLDHPFAKIQSEMSSSVMFPNYFSNDSAQWIHESFDKKQAEFTFYGAGALTIESGFPVCWNIEDVSLETGEYEVSIWTKVDNKKYGMPKWWLTGYNQANEKIFETSFSARDARDVQKSWVRSSNVFYLPPSVFKMELKAESNQLFYNDELWIMNTQDEVYYKDKASASSFLWNNFEIEELEK